MARITAQLNEQSYLNFIADHGQYVRWITGYDCPCIGEDGSPDPRHDPCQGRGKIYRYQTKFQIEDENSKHNLETVCPTYTDIIKVNYVKRCGEAYTVDSFTTDEITISINAQIAALPKPYEKIAVSYEYSSELTITTTSFTIYDDLIFRCDELVFTDTKTGRQYPQDIIEVVSLTDTTDSLPLTVSEFNRNFITVASAVNSAHTFSAVVKVINPQLFLLTGISEERRYKDAQITQEGDAQLIVPYNIFVGNGDLITALGAERRAQDLIDYVDGTLEYEVRAYDMSQVLQIIDNEGNTDFIEGTDFIQVKRNRIKFLAGGNKPNDKFNITYLLNPTYSIVDDIPMLRTSENKRLPRKVGLKVFDKVNEGFDIRTDIEGDDIEPY